MNLGRARLVGRTLTSLFAEEARRSLTRSSRASHGVADSGLDRRRERARAVRRAMEELGPLYIKIGQMLSTRPDMVPEHVMAELEHLHDRVTPTPFSDFEPVLAEELGAGWQRYFQSVDPNPVGTASLAQVYKVRLQSGRPAVVKVQRPGIARSVLDDMDLLEWVVARIAKRAPDFNDVLDLHAMLDVVFSSMRPELDFTLEADNMDAFRDRVADFDTLHIPEVIHVTPRVLVMSLAEGSSIRDCNPEVLTLKQREAIGTDLLGFMFWSYFVDRMFHADPHPGNIFVSPEGEATLLDWGQIGRVDINLSTAMAVVLLSMAMNDGTTLARTWIEMGRATRRADIAGFVNDMGRFVPGIAGQSLERFNFGVQLTSILKFSSKRGIAAPPAVASLGKSFANMEGSIRYLAPHISITDVFEAEFTMISQTLARELLSPEYAARAGAQTILMLLNGPGQARSILTDLANRDMTLRLGEEMSFRSRHENRADARMRRLQRNLLMGALGTLWLDRRRSRTRPATTGLLGLLNGTAPRRRR